ncbi:MAG: hypothetical protein ACBR50_06410 [Microcoleus sp.]
MLPDLISYGNTHLQKTYGINKRHANGVISSAKGAVDRWHSCRCRESLDRDENSAKLIKKTGLSHESGGGTPSLKKALAQREIEACGLAVLR